MRQYDQSEAQEAQGEQDQDEEKRKLATQPHANPLVLTGIALLVGPFMVAYIVGGAWLIPLILVFCLLCCLLGYLS